MIWIRLFILYLYIIDVTINYIKEVLHMNKITVVPSNENLDIIRTNDKLDESIKEDLCDLQMKNKE